MKKSNSPFHKQQLIRMHYCGEHLPIGIRLWNQKKIQWAMDNFITAQCSTYNEGEEQIACILKKNDLYFRTQHPIVIADPDKTIRHIYLADFIVEKKLIVEVDGCYHNKKKDEERDALTSKLGYKTLRIPRTDNCYNEDKIIKQIKDLLKE